jgi:hypothetical protein
VEKVTKSYKDRAPGEYAGRIGDAEGTVKVPDSGTFTTDDPAEQAFVENALGWKASTVKRGKSSDEKE